MEQHMEGLIAKLQDSLRVAEKSITETESQALLQLTRAVTDARIELNKVASDHEVAASKQSEELKRLHEGIKHEAASIRQTLAQADTGHEKRFKFLQILLSVVLGSTGVIGFLIYVHQQLVQTASREATELRNKAAEAYVASTNLLEQLKAQASAQKKTESGLREFLFLSLSERIRQVGESLSFRMSPEDKIAVWRALGDLTPFFIAATNTFGESGLVAERSRELYKRLLQFSSNAISMITITNEIRWSRELNQASIAALIRAQEQWERTEYSIDGWPESYQQPVRSLAAYRENVLMGAKLHLWNATGRDPQGMSEVTNHFSRAVSLDTNFAKPYNILAVAHARLMLSAMLSKPSDHGAISNHFSEATKLYEKAYNLATEPRTKSTIWNNRATIHYRWADFLGTEIEDMNGAANAYFACKHALDRAKSLGIPDSALLGTEAESVGVEALLFSDAWKTNRTELTNRMEYALGLLRVSKTTGYPLENRKNYMTETPLRHFARLVPDFTNRLETTLTNTALGTLRLR
jgi:hypothetical protein